jgi:hypothetical protein
MSARRGRHRDSWQLLGKLKFTEQEREQLQRLMARQGAAAPATSTLTPAIQEELFDAQTLAVAGRAWQPTLEIQQEPRSA